MRTKTEAAGEDLSVRIPRALAEEVGIEVGAEVDVSTWLGGIQITPAQRKRVRMEALLHAILGRKRGDEGD